MQPQCLILMPVGPGVPEDFVQDTINSVVAFFQPNECKICIIDNTVENRYENVDTGIIDKIYIRRKDIYDYKDVPQSIKGPLWLEQMRVFKKINNHYDYSVILRIDSDALITGPSPHLDILSGARAAPEVGIFGAFKVRGNGACKFDDMRHVGVLLQKEMSLKRYGPRALIRRGTTRRLLALKHLYNLAINNGYQSGFTVSGGAAFIMKSLVDRWIDMKLYNLSGIRFSKMPDDILFGLSTYAAGFKLDDAPVGLTGVMWKGLPYSPAEITRRGIKVIHSTKASSIEEEREIRQYFHGKRNNWKYGKFLGDG